MIADPSTSTTTAAKAAADVPSSTAFTSTRIMPHSRKPVQKLSPPSSKRLRSGLLHKLGIVDPKTQQHKQLLEQPKTMF